MTKEANIPILDLKQEYTFLKKDIDRELKECFETQSWILGAKVAAFEEKVAKYLKTKYAKGVASGTDALSLSLSALALKIKGKEFFNEKDEIITTPFTFIATAEAIIRCGAKPVFVDINPETFNIDSAEVGKAVTKNTVGIIPVHLYGLSVEMDAILKIAYENNLFVLEDTAQAFGGEYRAKMLGAIGDMGAFSFFPSKNLGGYGDGGLIATNDSQLADYVKILRNHGQIDRYNAEHIGFNSRLDAMQAAVLLAKFKYIDKFNETRQKIAQKYNQAFKDIKQIEIPSSAAEYKHVYHQYTIKVLSDRDKLLGYLKSKGIESRVYYPVLLPEMKPFKKYKIEGSIKNSEDVVAKVLSLPIHPFLKADEIEYVIGNVLSFF
jgi:dTDP-4-amino-4,6-dideoxygalactose transaminase